MMAGSKTLRSKGRIQMCEISNLQTSQIQLATHGRSIQTCQSATSRDTHLFDHLVGATEQRHREGEIESLGRLEVDNELDLCKKLDRQV
jgi:hypothetical protein